MELTQVFSDIFPN